MIEIGLPNREAKHDDETEDQLELTLQFLFRMMYLRRPNTGDSLSARTIFITLICLATPAVSEVSKTCLGLGRRIALSPQRTVPESALQAYLVNVAVFKEADRVAKIRSDIHEDPEKTYRGAYQWAWDWFHREMNQRQLSEYLEKHFPRALRVKTVSDFAKWVGIEGALHRTRISRLPYILKGGGLIAGIQVPEDQRGLQHDRGKPAAGNFSHSSVFYELYGKGRIETALKMPKRGQKDTVWIVYSPQVLNIPEKYLLRLTISGPKWPLPTSQLATTHAPYWRDKDSKVEFLNALERIGSESKGNIEGNEVTLAKLPNEYILELWVPRGSLKTAKELLKEHQLDHFIPLLSSQSMYKSLHR